MAQIKIIGKIFGLDNSIIPNKNFSIESKGLPIADANGVYLNYAYVKTDAQSNVKNKSGGDLYLTASDDPAVSTLCHFNLGGGYYFPFLLSVAGGTTQSIVLLRLAGGSVSAGDPTYVFINQKILDHKAEADPHPTYLNIARADIRYYLKAQTDAIVTAAIASVISTLRADVNEAGNNFNKIYTEILALKGIVGGTTPDGDDLINRLQEVYQVMNGFSESVNLFTQFANLQTALNNLESSLTNFFDGTLPNLIRLNFDGNALTGSTLPRADGDGNLIDSSITEKEERITFGNKPISGFSADVKEIYSNNTFLDGYVFDIDDNGKVLEFYYAVNNLFLIEGAYAEDVGGGLEGQQIEVPYLPPNFNCAIVMTEDVSPMFVSNTRAIKSRGSKTQVDGQDAFVSIYSNGSNFRIVGDLR